MQKCCPGTCLFGTQHTVIGRGGGLWEWAESRPCQEGRCKRKWGMATESRSVGKITDTGKGTADRKSFPAETKGDMVSLVLLFSTCHASQYQLISSTKVPLYSQSY